MLDPLLVEPSATPGVQDCEHPTVTRILDALTHIVIHECAADALSVTPAQARDALLRTRARRQPQWRWIAAAQALLWTEI
jgi:hypothetical protein